MVQTTPTSPAQIHGASEFDFTSAVTGRAYRVAVYQPFSPPPEAGYPVLVVTDGNMTFPLAAAMSAAFAMGGSGALVVGVGYPTQNPLEVLAWRRRDLTPPTAAVACSGAEDIGGADEFLSFLIDELRPAIAAEWPVDPDRQTLYGHSMGGLFAIDALLDRPEAFNAYVASSPSIWWKDCAVLEGECGFAARMQARKVAPRVLITVGAREQYVPARLPEGVSREQMQSLLTQARMVDNARELAVRLRCAGGPPGYRVQFHAFDGEDHTTALSASVGRAVAFTVRD
jgi:predicted alpha/beta superfamily hydrolase